MTGPVGNQNRAIAIAIRNLVSTYLGTEGFNTVPKPYHRRVSESLDSAVDPDVSGIDGVHIDVSSRLQHRLSDDLDAARRAGHINGSDVAVLVQYRPERPVSESYAIVGPSSFMPLRAPAHRPTNPAWIAPRAVSAGSRYMSEVQYPGSRCQILRGSR